MFELSSLLLSMQAQPGDVRAHSGGRASPSTSAQSRFSAARRGGTGRGGGNGEEGLAAAATAAAEFAPALRPYVLFLAAADSHSLNIHLCR